MTIANLQLPYDLRLDPMLEEMLKQLSMDKPNWFFRPHKERAGVINKSTRAVRDRGATAPEGTYFINKVDVVQDGRVAGVIWVEEEYRYRSDNRYNYVVNSTRINNGRKGNTMKSTKMDVSIRNAKKYFEPLKTGEMLYAMADDVQNSFDNTCSSLFGALRHHTMSGTTQAIRMQLFIRDVLSGNAPRKDTEASLREELFCSKYEEALSQYMLAGSMAKRKYQLVGLIDGDYCTFAEDAKVSCKEEAAKAPVWCGSFEQLPDNIQNKLAVLQLMENRELVLDVGYRHNEFAFLVALD